MKKLFIILSLLTSLSGATQEHLLYFEIGGASPMLSLNYESSLYGPSFLNYRVGVGYITGFDQFLTIPIGLTKLIKMKGNDFFELGAFYTLGINLNYDETNGIFFPNLGFRLYNARETAFFRLNFNPPLDLRGDSDFFPWGGISIGVVL